MIMHVIGARESHGTSKKTGNPYDLTFVTAVHQDTSIGARGFTAETLMLDAKQFPAVSVQLDEDYHVDYDSRGRVVAFSPVQHK